MNHTKEVKSSAHGKVIYALGNLLKVEFEGHILQGAVAEVLLEGEALRAEVIEIEGKIAKVQVFEDTKGVKFGTKVLFTEELVSVELGPGLLGEIFDGLQNPLEKVADQTGLFLQRGVYIEALDRVRRWDFRPSVKVGDKLERGDVMGSVPEGQFTHQIMLPFSMYGKYTVIWVIEPGSYPVDKVIVKVKDEKGHECSLTMIQRWPVKLPLIEGRKVKASKMLTTGMRILDTLISMVKGGTGCTPGPFGAGKTVTQHIIAKYSNVDIVVMIACGERAGEVVETLKTFPTLVDVHTHQPLMNRTTIICNTSSMPVAAREASVYVGITIAEYYRQMGLDILVLADSTSRWAQAMREMSGRLEEIPGEEAFPAYLSSRIAAFYERAGALALKDGAEGSVTLIGAVSPAGGNITSDPVSKATMNVVGCFICLSREFSDARKYPAVDPLKSWSKYISLVADEMKHEMASWAHGVAKAFKILAEGDEIGRRIEVVGQEGVSIEDIIVYLKAELFSFCYLQQNAFDPEDVYCSMEQQKIQFALMISIFDQTFNFKHSDSAKSYFLELQNKIKNLNFVPFNTEPYKKVLNEVKGLLEKTQELVEGAV